MSAQLSGNVNVLSYASNNVLTSAYTELVSSSPIPISALQICDTSGKILKIAIGASGEEKDILVVGPNSNAIFSIYIPKGSRLSIKAVDATASTGYNLMSFI